MLGLLCACLGLIDPGGRIASLEQKTLDARARAYAAPSPLSAGIVLVDISEQSVRRLEPVFGRWPWPRQAHAEVIAYLAGDGARAVAFDIIFSERSRGVRLDEEALRELTVFAGNADIPEVRQELLSRLAGLDPASGDLSLAGQAARAGNVVSPAVFYVNDAEARLSPHMMATGEALDAALAALGPSRVPSSPGGPEFPRYHNAIVPYPELAAASKCLGHNNFLPEPDGVTRRFLPLAGFGGDGALYPSLPLAVAAVALGLAPGSISVDRQAVRLGELRLPVSQDGSAFVRYQAAPDGGTGPAYASVPYEAVLASANLAAKGKPPSLQKGRFRDKIVIIGTTAVGLKDVRATPLAPLAPSFEIQANIVDAILTGSVPGPLPQIWSLTLIPLLCLAGALLLALPRLALGLPVALALIAAGPGASWLLYGQGLVAPMAAPGLATLAAAIAGGVTRYVRETREKSRIKAAFGQYLDPAVMEDILKHPDKLQLGGVRRVLTVLFSDIASFTSLAEKQSAEDVAAMLNAYFTRMAACVTHSGGIVDKFIGDALMAEWNAPGEVADHAARACRAALCMRRELARLNQERAGRGEPPIASRIGLNTGEMIVGNMGAENIFDYSVVGDEVNTASRLESLGKLFGVAVLAAAATAGAALELAPGEFVFRRLGRVRVKGRARDLTVFELAGSPDEITPEKTRAFAAYERGLEHYEAGRFEDAVALLGAALDEVPGDGPSTLLLDLCAVHAGDGGQFDGIIDQKEK